MAKLKKEIDALGKDRVKKLVSLSNEKRIALFEKAVDTDTAKKLNTELNRALISKKGARLKSWMDRNLDVKYREKLDKKFNNVRDFQAHVEEKLELWALQKEGVALTSEEVKTFSEMGKRFYEKAITLGDNLGDLVQKKEDNLAWAKALGEMQDFKMKLTPQSKWKTFTQTIGKLPMLLGIKSYILNIESNTVGAIGEGIRKRLSNWKFTSTVDGKIASEYRKNVRDIFDKTGIDFSRMISTDNPTTGIGKIVGEDIAKPKSKFFNAYADLVFKQMLGKPDVAFSSWAFSETAGLMATKFSGGSKKKANELFIDATRLVPQTTEGLEIRAQSISDAMFATYTNNSITSELSEKLRRWLNTGGLGVGDIVMPFVKTVANIAELGADYAGLGFVKATVKGGKMLGARSLDEKLVQESFRDITRAGLGMTTGFLIVSQMDVDHFVGAYDPERVKIDKLANSNYNAILIKTPIGEKWVSTDYFGVLAPVITGMLYAKKYGKDSSLGYTGKYVTSSTIDYLGRLPIEGGVGLLSTVYGSLTQYSSDERLKYFGNKTVSNLMDAMYARIVPGITYDLARATDEFQRNTKYGKYIVDTPLGDLNFNKFVQKVPYFRKDLPVEYDALGRVLYETSPVESLLFGARVRNAKMDALTDEIYRLRDKGFTPNIKDLRFMNSPKVEELKEKTGDNFYEVAREYGEALATKFGRETNLKSYQRISDEEKKDRLDKLGQDLYVQTLKKNGISYR